MLRFSPKAWLKLQFLLHRADTEIGGFGVCRDADDPLKVTDFITVPQKASTAFVSFDDKGVADFTEDMVDQDLKPHQFLRIWIHTHPGESASPSGVDEQTFINSFGKCDWAVMAIAARGKEVTARLRFNVGPRADFEMAHEICWSEMEKQASEIAAGLAGEWAAEMDKNLKHDRFEARASTAWSRDGYAYSFDDDTRWAEWAASERSEHEEKVIAAHIDARLKALERAEKYDEVSQGASGDLMRRWEELGDAAEEPEQNDMGLLGFPPDEESALHHMAGLYPVDRYELLTGEGEVTETAIRAYRKLAELNVDDAGFAVNVMARDGSDSREVFTMIEEAAAMLAVLGLGVKKEGEGKEIPAGDQPASQAGEQEETVVFSDD